VDDRVFKAVAFTGNAGAAICSDMKVEIGLNVGNGGNL
jgi:hypothetical protein